MPILRALRSLSLAIVVAATTLACAGRTHAQTAPSPERYVLVNIDSGEVSNTGKKRGVIYSTVVRAKRAPFMRLQFAVAHLGRTPLGGQPTMLRMTSLQDRAVQRMNALHLEQWGNSSCYFNGDAVRVEIIADPGAPPSRLVMLRAIAGFARLDEGGIATICGSTDDRVPSSEPNVARLMPVGCTGWLIDDFNHTFLTAGHCNHATQPMDVAQFNVPLSTSNGTPVAPPPEDQYAIDPASVQDQAGGSGNDWCYFGCFPNPNTGLTPYEAQGEFFTLAAAAPPVEVPAQTIRITGCGSTSAPISPTWYLIQKTHSGPYSSQSGTRIDYRVDTSGGNSGSPVFDLDTNTAIGIHTNGGCTSGGGTNFGTAVHNANLQNALDNPQGVCIPNPLLTFLFADGLPETIDPSGDSIRVEIVSGSGGGTPDPGTGILHYDIGAGWQSAPMSAVSPNVYDAIFPASVCGSIVKYYFTAETTSDDVVASPFDAPATFYEVLSSFNIGVAFQDNFETDFGWTVASDAALTTGAWQRGVPINSNLRDPPADADNSGQCYVTENVSSADIDGGATTLTSPVMDASDPESAIEYFRWFSTSSTVNPPVDRLVVEVSDDGGATWEPLETYSAGVNEWFFKSWLIADIPNIANTSQFQIRFRANDAPAASIAEAGVDGVRLSYLICEDPNDCPADFAPGTGDGVVDVNDLLILIGAWGPCPGPPGCPGDINADGVIDVNDLLILIGAWGPC